MCPILVVICPTEIRSPELFSECSFYNGHCCLSFNQAIAENCRLIGQYIFSILHLIGQSNVNEILPDKTSYRMLLDVNTQNIKLQQVSMILIRFVHRSIYRVKQSPNLLILAWR